jgi:CheY-like chemotaxis protein
MKKKSNGDRRPILIVEQDAEGRDALRMVFEAWGYPVVTAASELHAFRMRAAYDPDVMVIGLHGREECELIRRVKSKATRGLSVVAYSGAAAVERAARAAGADDFIVKPDIPKLERVLLHGERGAASAAPRTRGGRARRA